jgi:hypothetical protein
LAPTRTGPKGIGHETTATPTLLAFFVGAAVIEDFCADVFGVF